MGNSKTKKYFPVIIIFIDIVLIVFLIWLVTQVNNLSGQNALVKNQLDTISLKESRLSTSKMEASRLVDSLQKISGYFISPEEKIVVIDNLEKLASRAGIAYTLNNAVDGERMSLDMNVKGSFQNIYYFIRLLETSGYWVSFENFSLSRGTTGKTGGWSGSIVINIPNSTQ
jgi:hypothetical protein